MKKIIVALTLLASFSAYADLVLNIKIAADMKLTTVGVYASTSNGFFCSHLNGDLERVPKTFDRDIAINSSGASNQIIIAENLNDRCRSELKGVAIKVNHPKNTDQVRLELVSSKINQDQNDQKIIFVKFPSPYGDVYAPYGENRNILVGPNGIAQVDISSEE